MADRGLGSSEHLERLHEIFRGLHKELQGAPERLRGNSAAEEKKKLLREFEEKQKEANETLTCWFCANDAFYEGLFTCALFCNLKHCSLDIIFYLCELNLREMEEELKYAPVSFHNQIMIKIRAYRRDLVMFQRKMRSTDLGMVPGGPGEKRYGIFSEENQQSTHMQSQRVLLLQGTESLNRASQSIERSHQIAAETDQIGTDIIEELGEQREQLDRTKSRLVNTSENLSKSRKILRSMSRRLMTNKLLLSVIIILEVAILAGIVYYKFFT